MSDADTLNDDPGSGAEATPGQMVLTASRHAGRGAVASPTAAAEPAAPAQKDAQQLVQMALWSLRGRYLLAAVLGLLTAALFGFAGWRGATPTYTSQGLVRIAYILPSVMGDQRGENQLPIETFMLSQRLLMTSSRVIDLAAQDPVWKQYGRSAPADPALYYEEVLRVDVRPRSEFISVNATDTDPAMAAAAVTAIINAYEFIYTNQESQIERQRIGVLEEKQQTLQSQMDLLSEQLRAAAKEYGSTRLDGFYLAAQTKLNELQQRLHEVNMAMATAPATPSTGTGRADGPPAGAEPPAPATAAAEPHFQDLTPDQIALNDTVMGGFLQEQARLESQLRQFTARGYGEAHRDVLLTRAALQDLEERTSRRARAVNQFRADAARAAAAAPPAVAGPLPGPAGGNPGAPGGAYQFAGRTLQQLTAAEAIYQKLYKSVMDEMKAIGNKQIEIQQIEAELQAKRTEFSTLTRRIDQLRAEGSIGGRLSVVSTGGIPGAPSRDRRLQFAGAGAFAGLFLPATLILGASLLWRKYRFSDETEADVSANAPLLGILPELKGTAADAEQRTAAAHSVHQIRVSLQARALRDGHPHSQVYLFTSASAGEGKTTLAASLALSFAASRLRTLVIDCDLVGRNLTSSLQGQGLEGLHEALEDGTIRGRVRRTDAGLYVLTAGVAGASDAPAMSPGAVRAVLEEARRHFHVILLDTGPVLGSIEAAVLAQEADGAVMVISRGQHRGLVQRAMRRLQSLGTPVLGFVFNRAKPQDFQRSVCASTSQPADGVVAAAPSPVSEPASLMRFGPVVRAVATDFPADDAVEAANEPPEEAAVS